MLSNAEIAQAMKIHLEEDLPQQPALQEDIRRAPIAVFVSIAGRRKPPCAMPCAISRSGIIEDIMGPIFDYGYGPFRWICLSGSAEDLHRTDQAALSCIDPERRCEDRDNYL